MEITLYEGLLVFGIGILGLVGSIHMENQLGGMNIGLTMGPAKWAGAISLILVVCGIVSVIGHLRKVGKRPGMASRFVSRRGMTLIALLPVWVAAVPFLGFNIGLFLFFPLLFYVSGFRPWFKSVAAGFIMAVGFYLIFVLGAKIPVPKGGIGL